MPRIDAALVNRETHVLLPADSNQALGLAQYAIDFLWGQPGKGADPAASVVERINLFHTDATIAGLSAIALGTNAPNLLRREAAEYPATPGAFGAGGPAWARKAVRAGVPVFGSRQDVAVEKAVVANASAVREWDTNGTNFGYNPRLGQTAGEFGHNDFYAVPIAAAQLRGLDGKTALRGMLLLDEVRGRLAEAFSLKTYKIDHVLHGAIGSAVTFGAMMGATAEQIESAVGMVVAHHVPFRAIRAGKQLSDSKGASAAISTEAAVLAVKRSMGGFLGPRDIFRNPEAVFRIFEGPGQMFQKVGGGKANTERADASPFDLCLARAGDDFAVMGMHFKLGLYEHQSAGALQGLINIINRNPALLDDQTGDCISKIVVRAYEPAFGIIGDPAKRDPKTRQSADHSMLYLVCTMLRKALELHSAAAGRTPRPALGWKELMLTPHDFSPKALHDPLTRELMGKMSFEHGGPEYDAKYPDGIPTSIVVTDDEGATHDSGLVMYPGGHARNHAGPDAINLKDVLAHKFEVLGRLAVDDPKGLIARLSNVEAKNADAIASLYDFTLKASAEAFD
ncbi:MAG: MmgE/PrpD family protein [Phycisphaeraceae bacterium]|nr:MAG: MmgE/PrpD family protein [Phycisphaeraceae bacterium]